MEAWNLVAIGKSLLAPAHAPIVAETIYGSIICLQVHTRNPLYSNVMLHISCSVEIVATSK